MKIPDTLWHAPIPVRAGSVFSARSNTLSRPSSHRVRTHEFEANPRWKRRQPRRLAQSVQTGAAARREYASASTCQTFRFIIPRRWSFCSTPTSSAAVSPPHRCFLAAYSTAFSSPAAASTRAPTLSSIPFTRTQKIRRPLSSSSPEKAKKKKRKKYHGTEEHAEC